MFPEGITPMEQQRVYASSVLDQEGNMWVTGGNYENNASDSTEVYEYKPKGAGKWRKGYPLPKSYRNTGIESHCTVRINATHIFMGGGFLTEYKIQDELEYGGGEYPEGDGQYEYADYGDGEYADYGKGEGGEYYEGDYPKEGADTKLPEEQDQRERKRRRRADDDAHYTDSNYDYSDETGGALQTEKVWLFDGNTWNEMSPMSIARDRPACSIINMPDGKINILVAGGCDGWCAEKPPIKNVEMYNVETNAWQKLADLPIPLSSAKLELLGNRPTIIGGYDLDADTQNGKLYQYFVETDEWKAHDVEMRLPRSSAAVFQVPRNFFRC